LVSDHQPGTVGQSTASSKGYSKLHYFLYLAPFVIVPLVIFAAALIVIPTDWFADRSNNLFMDTLGYGAALHNADCKIAVYGDSTAVVGVDPLLIRKQTGLSTCNIAEVAGVLIVNGTMPLDQFLAQNPRPQFIVFLFAPESLNPESQRHNPEITTFEGVTYRMRQPHRLAGFFSILRRHPEDAFGWVDHGVRMAIGELSIKPYPPDTKYTRFRTLGQTTFRNPPLTSCNYPHHNPLPDLAWIEKLRSKYSAQGTTVILDATPVPACDPDRDFFVQHFKGVIDNSFEPLPLEDYYAGGRHVYPAGAELISQEISAQILQRLNSTSTPGGR